MIQALRRLISLTGQVILAGIGGSIAVYELVATKWSGLWPLSKPHLQTRHDTPLGMKARSVNGRIHPWGRPTTYWFEYGETTAYGRRTPEAALPPRIGAYYRESWNAGLAGWYGDINLTHLEAVQSGGVDGRGYVSYELGESTNIDAAHIDGIGSNILAQIAITGDSVPGVDNLALGGGEPDFRGAKIKCFVRGQNVDLRKSELAFWAQSAPPGVLKTGNPASNWAYTGAYLTDALQSGNWEPVSYTLDNDTNSWSYAGCRVGVNEAQYIYMPLDQVLSHLNLDMFHMLALFDSGSSADRPYGRIDFDEFELAYRNHSVLLPSNGGTLVSAPLGGDPPSRLTDGWRNGANHTWRSALSPTAPLEFVYKLAKTVAVHVVQIHQNPDWPSKEVEVFTSLNGVDWTLLFGDVIPATHPSGPNFMYVLKNVSDAPVNANWIRVRINSGYQDSAWGLGEIQVFGRGAIFKTDYDWYSVTADLEDLQPGKAYHWRLVAKSDAGIVKSADKTFVMPADDAPWVKTLRASRIGGRKARLEGRIDPMGLATSYYFEYGPTPDYGMQTTERYGGVQITPRTVTDIVEGLTSGVRYHVRLVARNATGTTFGADRTFTAK